MHALALSLSLALVCFVRPADTRPPVSDLERFPDLQTAAEWHSFAGKHIEWLEGQISLGDYHFHRYYSWLCEARWRRNAWWCLLSARANHWQETVRDNLAELRRAIGPEAYARGEMPAPVPVWRFGRR